MGQSMPTTTRLNKILTIDIKQKWFLTNPVYPGTQTLDLEQRYQAYVLIGKSPAQEEDKWLFRCLEREKRRQLDRKARGELDYHEFVDPSSSSSAGSSGVRDGGVSQFRVLDGHHHPVRKVTKGGKLGVGNIWTDLKTGIGTGVEVGKKQMEEVRDALKDWRPPSSIPPSVSLSSVLKKPRGGGVSMGPPKWLKRGPVR